MGIIGACLEELGMTVQTGKNGEMELVAEENRAESGNLDRNLFGQMAKTALIKTKRRDLVVTLPAGLALLHLSHRKRRVFLPDLEENIMTESAVTAEFFQVRVMREWYSTDNCCFD